MRLDFIAIWLEAISNTFRRKGKESVRMDACLNCSFPVTPDLSYCPNCGQKLTFSYVTIGSLLGEFFSNLFNFDNSIFRSLRMLLVPAFLPREYMEGRRKKYLNPVRFFFVTLVILFSVISFVTDFGGLDFFTEDNAKKIAISEFKHDYTLWKDSLDNDLKRSVVLDSLESDLLSDYADVESDSMDHNLKVVGINMRDYRFLRRDLYEMDIDTLLVHYEVEKFWDRLVISQFVRTMRDPGGAVQFFVGNMLWGIISTIFILSLFMKLFYIRRSRFYVEHAIVLFTIHTFSFVVITIASLLMNNFMTEHRGVIGTSAAGLTFLYSFLTFKRYYRQGFLKTFIKFIMTLVFYSLIITLMIGVVFTASLLLFK